MAIREGRWDCQVCGTAGNLGRDKVCPHCGAPRPLNAKFYLPKGSRPVSQPDQIRDAQAGPDWQCDNCGATNAGYRVFCNQCGAPKPARAKTHVVTDYAPGDAPTFGDRGPQPEKEWVCQNCGATNPQSRVVCSNCGVRRGETGSQKFNREAKGEPKPATPRQKVAETIVQVTSRLPALSFDRTWLYYGAIAVAVLLILFSIWFTFIRTVETPVTVTGFHWERSVSVEIYKTVTEEDWSIPSGGRYISESRQIHHYDQVVDHYETRYKTVCQTVQDGYNTVSEQVCNREQTGTETYVCGHRDLGNGYFEDVKCSRAVYTTVCHYETHQQPRYRQECHQESYQDPVYRSEPRYATKYTYEIERWIFSRAPVAALNDHDPFWPSFTLAQNEREAGRAQKYIVFFADEKGKEYAFETEFDRWSNFALGQHVLAKINTIGQITEVMNEDEK